MQFTLLSKLSSILNLYSLKTYPLVLTNSSIHLVQQVKYWLLNSISKTSHHIYSAYSAFLCLRMKATEKSSEMQQDCGTTNKHHSMHTLKGTRGQHKNLLSSLFTYCELNTFAVFVYETSTYSCRATTRVLKTLLQLLYHLEHNFTDIKISH